MNETVVTVVGNLARDPEVRFLEDGTPLCRFTVVTTPRFLAPATGVWTDGNPVFLRCSAWQRYAENIAASLGRGARVLVVGELRQRGYRAPDGTARSVVDLRVREVAPALRWCTAEVSRQRPGETPPPVVPAPREGDAWTAVVAQAARAEHGGEPPF